MRRAAYEAEAGADAHGAELDELYGQKVVQNLNAQARVMGYHDYSELSYVRMNRIGYGPEEVRKSAIRSQTIWCTSSCKNGACAFAHVSPILPLPTCPSCSRTAIIIPAYKARMDAARTMYHELSPETAEFIDFMQENELFDVEAAPANLSGGYMTSLPSHGTFLTTARRYLRRCGRADFERP